MTAFTVWKFEDPDGADRTAHILRNAEVDKLVKIEDHAVVRWPVGESRPTTTHSHDQNWRGAGWGSVFGLLIGTLFFIPVIGGIAGAALGALSKASEDTGIPKEQLEKIRTEVTPGTSALFLVTEQGNLDRLGERLRGMKGALIATNLTDGEREILTESIHGV